MKLSFLSKKVEVQQSPIHGKGLFAATPIAKDEIVCIKGGYIYDRDTLDSMNAWYAAAEIQIADDLYIGPSQPQEREGSMIFSNHSCDPNIGVQGQIVFVAMRDIQSGEELTHDWATTDDDTYSLNCNCGAGNCRKVITGQDWRRADLQQKYKDYFSWYLARKVQGDTGDKKSYR